MISEKQKQIIRLLLTNKEGYNINQIAKILNISISWTHEALKQLETQGILKSIKKANAIIFTLNWSDPRTEKLCELILLDSNQKPIKKHVENKIEKITPEKINHYSKIQQDQKDIYTKNITQNKDSYNPSQSPASFSFYSVNPIGDQGMNNVLFKYAKSGAFGGTNANYNTTSSTVSNTIVPPETLGSKVSKNVSGYTMAVHTTAHRNISVSGCRYCG